ncbi:MAG: AmmeMemoRadiSam system protein B [Candidatus Stahlbacteria bacterium]|nr:AmmeMemoRadiSam system protein B [Candidatus Stahlbacteria bacterium]
MSENIRPPAVAGMWYPAEKQELQEMISQFLLTAETQKIEDKLYGIIVPHAGYEYSGKTAASAFKQLIGLKYETIIVIGPYHGPKHPNAPTTSFRGISVWNTGAFKTPLGDVKIDTAVANRLIAYSDKIKYVPEAHTDEHSVEAEIPFLQTVIKEFKIVPIVMVDQSYGTCKILSSAIVKAIQELKLQNVLICASSDFYHGVSYEECKKSTNKSKELIADYDTDGFADEFVNKSAACGGGAIIVAMLVSKELGGNKIIPLSTTNSGDITGNKSGWVVGYNSFLITGSENIEWAPLDMAAQKELIKIARATMESYVKIGKVMEFDPQSAQLKEKRGVFVTIMTKTGELRGCIGHHIANTPLYKLVPEMSIASATQDYRFPPLSKGELKNIKIKLSVYLCEVHPIKDISEYKLGEHGIIMQKGNYGATFLPEVPIEEGWTVQETLKHLCLKAGLPLDGWKGADFYVYKTQVFGE